MNSDRNPRAMHANAKRTTFAAALIALLFAPLGVLAPAAATGGPTLVVSAPLEEVTYTQETTYTIVGVVSPANCSVEVNGHPVDVNETTGAFHFTVELVTGNNSIRIVGCPDHEPQAVVERMIVLDEGSVLLTIDSPAREFVTNQTSVVVSGHTDVNATVTVNGENVTVNATTGAFETEVALEVGENHITVVASDGLGNETTVTIFVLVDQTAPVIELLLGEDLAYAIEHGVNITWTKIEVGGTVDQFHTHVQVNGVDATMAELHFSARVYLEQGENLVTVTATDAAGNTAEVSFTVWVDSVAPTITLDLDANVTAAIEAGDAIHQTTLEVRGSTDTEGAFILVNEHEANVTGLNFTRTVELHDGWNVIVIVAKDPAHNRGELRLEVLVDLSNPGLAVTLDDAARDALAHERPLNHSSVSARVESNASTVRFTLNGNLMSEWSGSMNLSITLSEGNNTLLFEAIEGELTSSEEIHLKLDTTAPTLYVELNGTTEDNGTFTTHSRLLRVNGTTETGATVKICTSGPGADATTWCKAVEVGDHGNFERSVEIDKEVENTVTVTATDRAGNSVTQTFTVVYAAPVFDSNTTVTVHIGGLLEGEGIAGHEIVLEVGSEVDIPDGANVSWYIDGEYVGSGHRLKDVVLEEGNHTIEVVVTVGDEVASGSREIHVEPEAARPATPAGFGLWVLLAALGLGVAGMAYASTDRGRYMLAALMLGSVFGRLKKPAPLDHFVRGQLFQLIRDEPGIHYAELKRRANLPNGSVAYHLSVLEKAGVLRTVQDGTRTRFYPTDAPLDRETYGLSDGDRAVLENVTQAPGISETELSEKVGKSLSTVSRSVDRMAALGYITTTRQGRTVNVFPRTGSEGPQGAVELPGDEA